MAPGFLTSQAQNKAEHRGQSGHRGLVAKVLSSGWSWPASRAHGLGHYAAPHHLRGVLLVVSKAFLGPRSLQHGRLLDFTGCGPVADLGALVAFGAPTSPGLRPPPQGGTPLSCHRGWQWRLVRSPRVSHGVLRVHTHVCRCLDALVS